MSVVLRVSVDRESRHGTSCGLARGSASKDSRPLQTSGFLILCGAQGGVAATRLRNGDGEIPRSEANAETCLRQAGAVNAEERREETAEFVAWNKEPGD